MERFKLVLVFLSWKVFIEVGKIYLKLKKEQSNEKSNFRKYFQLKPIFHLWLELSNFDGNFPISMKTFQLLDLANYTYALFAT